MNKNKEIVIHEGRIEHLKGGYALYGIYVTKEYFKNCNLTKEELRLKILKETGHAK